MHPAIKFCIDVLFEMISLMTPALLLISALAWAYPMVFRA